MWKRKGKKERKKSGRKEEMKRKREEKLVVGLAVASLQLDQATASSPCLQLVRFGTRATGTSDLAQKERKFTLPDLSG